TLQVTSIVVLISLVIGVVMGVALTYGSAWLRWPVRIYSDFIRGIPVLVLIFFSYYGLPALGLNLDNFTAAVVALTAFKVSHVIENTRGAIQSIHHGQMEAAKAIGLPFWKRLIYVIFPQAVRRFLPAWINTVADAAKGSALVSLIGVVDLMLAMQKVIGRTFEPIPIYIAGAIIYILINYTLSVTSRRMESRFSFIQE
ncbi:MAG: amino acid ABC transporter permease, partial [Hyphomicrobiales bacterium]|nr:amino acid ABC transporter permease [Hyphomicrobiales bacterium]